MKSIEERSLLPHESFQSFNGFEYLTYFEKGHPDKPLIVFFPGWAHLARIAYAGGDIPSTEFLAHAFLEKGYSFLAVSYPLEHPIYSTPYPQMRMQDWAEAAAAMAEHICKRYALPSVIPVHWSAAGHLITCFHQASQRHNLLYPFSVALEATPPILISPDRSTVAEIQTNGLISVRKIYENWQRQLSTMLGYELDLKTYEKCFLGAFPVCLLGSSLIYENGNIKEDLAASVQDRHSFDYREAPLVVSIAGNSQHAPYHPLVDKASWSFINERKIYHDFLAPYTSQIAQLSKEQWNALLKLVQTFSCSMNHTIEGNHFLFVGQRRAQQIVQIIEKAREQVPEFSEKLRASLKIQKAL